MSESRVEELLSQMTLTEASPELDHRVMKLINEPEFTARRSVIRTARLWVLPTVAAVSLLVGIAIGQRTSVAASGDETAAVGIAAAGQRAGYDTRESSAEDRNSAVNDQHSGLPAPRISLLCAVRREDPAVTEQQQCSACHSRRQKAQQFADGIAHVHRTHRQLCARCHDMSRDWEKEDVHGALFGPEDPAPQGDVPGDA